MLDAIHLVEPEYFATINQAGETWADVSANMTRCLRDLREREHLRLECAYFVEPNTTRPGLHLHGYLWGDLPDSSPVDRAATRSGMGDVLSMPISHHLGLGYTLKMMGSDEERESFLDANNGRLVHSTRGFWRGPDGLPVPGGYSAVVSHWQAASGVAR